jgi:hypothetical protein
MITLQMPIASRHCRSRRCRRATTAGMLDTSKSSSSETKCAHPMSGEQLNHTQVAFVIKVNGAGIHCSIPVNIFGSGIRKPVHVCIAMKYNSPLVRTHIYAARSNKFGSRDDAVCLEQCVIFSLLLFVLQGFPITASDAAVSVPADLTTNICCGRVLALNVVGEAQMVAQAIRRNH